jgi:hypothetical protein
MELPFRNGIRLPRGRRQRIALGVVLIAGGLLGFLPILGFWMIPLGFAVLSVDLPWMRRRRRRLVVWWGRRWPQVVARWRARRGRLAAWWARQRNRRA